jgi:hypothetical protein
MNTDKHSKKRGVACDHPHATHRRRRRLAAAAAVPPSVALRLRFWQHMPMPLLPPASPYRLAKEKAVLIGVICFVLTVDQALLEQPIDLSGSHQTSPSADTLQLLTLFVASRSSDRLPPNHVVCEGNI